MIFTLYGCKSNKFTNDITIDNSNKDEDTYMPDTNIEDLELLKNAAEHLFIDVVDTDYIILTKNVLGINVNWKIDNEYCFINNDTISFVRDGKTKITAIFNKNDTSYEEFVELKIENKKIKSMTINGLTINYNFITNNPKKIGSSFTPSMIVFHNTANTAKAMNEVMYLNSPSNTSSTSFHYAVDDNEIYQAIPLTYYSYHAGNLEINKKSIGIEIAKSMLEDEKIKDQAILNGIKLINLLKYYYNIDKKDVITHQAASGKYCPHDILSRYGLENFLKLIDD